MSFNNGWLLKERILFVFSDPGGAKPILALITNLGLTDYKVVSDRRYSFYTDFDIPVCAPAQTPEADISEFLPSLVFTGTSYTSQIELNYLRVSKDMQIATVSFIDHWTNLSKRFINAGGTAVLPDEIWVVDDAAASKGVSEGLLAETLKVSGNPYHVWLAAWKPSLTRSRFLTGLGLNADLKYVLYVPDPLTNSPDNYGFDELNATQALVDFLKNNRDALMARKVLLKPHPNQQVESLASEVDASPDMMLIPAETDMNTCIYYSDLVIGFFSSALIEARIMGKPVARYIPASALLDPLHDKNSGPVASTFEMLFANNRNKWN